MRGTKSCQEYHDIRRSFEGLHHSLMWDCSGQGFFKTRRSPPIQVGSQCSILGSKKKPLALRPKPTFQENRNQFFSQEDFLWQKSNSRIQKNGQTYFLGGLLLWFSLQNKFKKWQQFITPTPWERFPKGHRTKGVPKFCWRKIMGRKLGWFPMVLRLVIFVHTVGWLVNRIKRWIWPQWQDIIVHHHNLLKFAHFPQFFHPILDCPENLPPSLVELLALYNLIFKSTNCATPPPSSCQFRLSSNPPRIELPPPPIWDKWPG